MNQGSTHSASEDEGVQHSFSIFYHVSLGLWLGFAAYIAIAGRSASAGLNILTIGAFFAVPAICIAVRKWRWKWAKPLAALALVLWWAVILYGVSRLVDRLYIVNASTYPVWLATSVTVTPEQATAIGGSDSLCQGLGVGEFYRKENGVFLQCGAFQWWGKTFYIENYDEAYSAWQSENKESAE